MKIHRLLLIALIVFTLTACYSAAPADDPLPTPLDASIATPEGINSQTPTPTIPQPTTQEATATSLPTATFTEPPNPTPEPAGPPGIILFIGDGMGTNQRLAATWLVSGEGGLLVMDNMPVHGMAQTASANDPVTDSAAASTAMATGTLTNNGFMGVDPSKNSLTTILELAQVSGWSVGLVTTTQLAHATPGAFASHYPDRSNLPEIARQMMVHNIDVLLGGGEDDFFSKDERGCYPGTGHQNIDSSLVDAALESGYTYLCTAEELQSLDPTQEDRVLGLFSGEGMVPPFNPNLAQMTQTALDILSQDEDGFFLMVEAGQIDWAAHENEAMQTMQNTVGLDTAVAMAQIYALENPNTLIIVTGDHETGGMRINLDGAGSYRQDGPFSMPDGRSFWIDWSTTGHTPDPIPVTAQGPFSEMLAGEYPLTQIFQVMTAMLFNSGQ